MQTNLFTKEQINKESSVGEFYKGEVSYDTLTKLYFSYQGVEELFLKAQEALAQNKKVIFTTKSPIENTDIYEDKFLKDSYQGKRKITDGLMTSHFASLLTPKITGQKILGNYSLAFIEAYASKIFHDKVYPNQAVDHFYNAQGISSIATLHDVLKAFDIKKNEMISLVLPANALKAFQNNKYSTWFSPELETDFQAQYKMNIHNKKDKKVEASLNLMSQKISNLTSPLYKIKVDDRWVAIVPWQAQLDSLKQKLTLELSNELLVKLKTNKDASQESEGEVHLEASVGQAARVIFEFLDGDYDNLPEAILNFEGGSWSSIALENCSSGRYQGTNSMQEVLDNKWYQHQDIAIPWNYLGFDTLNDKNQELLDDSSTYLMSFDKQEGDTKYFLEANQNWKKIINELTAYTVKFVYREFSAIASKKYLLSTKEIMLMAARFIANLSIHDFDKQKPGYKEALKEYSIPGELTELLETVVYAHVLLSAKANFHSCKTHSANIVRLKTLKKIQVRLEKLCPISSKNFKQKIFNLLQKDYKTENTTLWNLYQTA